MTSRKKARAAPASCRWPGTYFGLLKEERELLKATARGVAMLLEHSVGDVYAGAELRDKLAQLEASERLALEVGRGKHA